VRRQTGKVSETAIKSLSEQGKLAQFRVLHFATHGTVAGESHCRVWPRVRRLR